MKRVIYIPTIHSPGEMQDPLLFNELITPSLIKQHNELWDNIFSGLSMVPGSLEGIKMYIEGSTVEVEGAKPSTPLFDSIPNNVRGFQSKQLLLIHALHNAGARQMITEDPLLLDESLSTSQTQLNFYRGLRSGEINSISGNRIVALLENRVREQSKLRDLVIANNINSSLADGEVGLLVLGIGHNVEPFLSDDVSFEFLNEGVHIRWEGFQRHLLKEDERRRVFLEGQRPIFERL